MSYSQDAERYPSEFGELLLAAVTEEVKVGFPSAAQALRFRGRMYAYVGALKRAAHSPDTPSELQELWRISAKVQFRVEGPTFVARPLDLDPDALLLRKAFQQPAPEAPQLPRWLKELAEKQAKGIKDGPA